MFNLIHDPWIAVRHKDGTRSLIAPWQITENLTENPIVALDATRPDFNGALIQFLIGLVQTVIAPKDDRSWRNGLNNPPGEPISREPISFFSPSARVRSCINRGSSPSKLKAKATFSKLFFKASTLGWQHS